MSYAGTGGRDQRGSGTVLMAALMSVVVALAATATVVAGYLASHHQARSAADLAALSGAAWLPPAGSSREPGRLKPCRSTFLPNS